MAERNVKHLLATALLLCTVVLSTVAVEFTLRAQSIAATEETGK